MATIIVGLGNPGSEYEKTRHNAGRNVVELFAKQEGFDEFKENTVAKVLVAKGSVDGESVTLVLPQTMMNLSGKAVSAFVKSPTKASKGSSSGASKDALRKAGKNLVVVQDDLDVPLGTIKMVFGRGSGGHKGVESIMRAIKTKDFARIRIGISGVGKKNQAKKVSGEEKIIKHVVGKWKPTEEAVVKKVFKKSAETLRIFVSEGLDQAMMFANTR
jgi:PTH1 family peptidyl-tRNA hydrolase